MQYKHIYIDLGGYSCSANDVNSVQSNNINVIQKNRTAFHTALFTLTVATMNSLDAATSVTMEQWTIRHGNFGVKFCF